MESGTQGDVLAAPSIVPRGVRLASALGVRDAGRALRDFTTYLPTKILPAVAGFLALAIVARKLTPTDYGVLAIAQTLVSLGWIGAGQWLTSTITRELPADLERGDIETFARRLRAGLKLTSLLFVAFFALLSIGATLSHAVAGTFLLVVAASAGLITQNLAIVLFQASLRPRAYMLVEVVARVGGMALGVYLVFEGHGLRGYLVGIAAVSCVVGAAGLLAAWPGRVRGEAAGWTEVRPWVGFGFPASLSSMAVWGLLFVDRYLLSLLRSTKEVGVYTLASLLADKPIAIPMLAFAVATRPLLVRAFEQRGRAEAERLLASYTRIVLLLAVPIVAFVTITREPLLLLLVGGTARGLYYEPATTLIPIIALGSFVGVLALLSNAGLTLGRRTRPMVYAALIGLGVNVVANLILIPPYGMLGAAIATPVGMAAYLGATQFWSARFLTWRFPYGTLVRTVAAATAGSAASLAVIHAAGWSGIVSLHPELGQLGVTALLGGAVYAVVLAGLGERRAWLRPEAPLT